MVNKSIRGNFPNDENVIHLNSMVDLKAIIVNDDIDTVVLDGYYVKGDNGGGLFIFDVNSVIADNGGTVIIPTYIGFGGTGRWIRVVNDNILTARMFGALTDGTNQSIEIQALKDYCVANGAIADLGPGIFSISTTIKWHDGDSGLIFKGAGITQTTLKWIGAAGGTVISSIGVIQQNIHNHWKDFTIDCNIGANNAFVGLRMTFSYNSYVRIRILTPGTRGIFADLGFYNLFENCEVNNGIIANGAAGFFFGDTFNANTMLNCRSHNNWAGVRLDIDGGLGRPESISITDCTIEGNSYVGIYGQSCIALSLKGCHIESNGSVNLQLGSGASASVRCIIDGNNFLGVSPILMSNASDTTLTNNYINDGINITSSCSAINVVNNLSINGVITDNGLNTLWINNNAGGFYKKINNRKIMDWAFGGLRTDLKTNTNDFRISLNDGTSDVTHVDFLASSSVTDFKVPVTITTAVGGFTLPRLNTTQRNAIVGPLSGTMIWNTTNSLIEVFNGLLWKTAP